MSRENLETMRRVIEAINRKDVDAVVAAFVADAKLYMPMETPRPGAHQGHDAVRGFLEDFYSRWTEFMIEIDELIPHEEVVVALVRWRGTGRLSGIEVSQTGAFSCTFDEGRIKSIAFFAERARALEAAGVSSASA